MKKANVKHLIWNQDFDEDAAMESIREEYPDDYGILSDEELLDIVREDNDNCLECERENLKNIFLPGKIVVLGTLGLYDGAKYGYRELKTQKAADILKPLCEGTLSYCKFYSDGYDICGTEEHHDGTNLYVYRYIRPGVNIQNLYSDIVSGKNISKQEINRYTGSLVPFIHPIYGWKVPGQFAKVSA